MLIKNKDSPPKKNNKQKQTTHTQNNKQTHTNKLKKNRKIKHRIFNVFSHTT